MSDQPVLLFPGLGAYSTGVLRQAAGEYEEVSATFNEIDDVAGTLGVPSVSAALFRGEPRSVRELLAERSEVLQLAIFGVSIAVSRVLLARGTRPALLVGHSFGELAAVVTAGAFSLADGVRMVYARAEALRPWEGRGGMAAVGVDEDTARHLIGVLDEEELVVGCLNAPRQTVVAGPLPTIDRAERVAVALDFFFARLNLPYASHHPAMRPAVADFTARMAGIRQNPLRQNVYSPIHRRRYTDDDDLRQAVAECIVLPVRFTETVRDLHAKGYTTFVECGALNALTACVEHTVPGVRTFAPLVDAEREVEGLRAATALDHALDHDLTGRTAASDQPETQVAAPLAGQEHEPVRERVDVPAQRVAPAGLDRRQVVAELRELYAQALEYPPDLLTEDALLEAELGVDSLKQTSLLTKVVDRFGLRDRAEELPVWELPTLGQIADYVTEREPAR